MRNNLRSSSKKQIESVCCSTTSISDQSHKISKPKSAKKYPAYKQYSKLNKHYRYINQDQNICPICQKDFSDIYTMKTHLKGVHNLNPHLCKGCSLSFKNVKELKDHIEYTHIPKNNKGKNKEDQQQISQLSRQSNSEIDMDLSQNNFSIKIEDNNFSCDTLSRTNSDQQFQNSDDPFCYKSLQNGIEIIKLLGGQLKDGKNNNNKQKKQQNIRFNIFNIYGYGPDCKKAGFKNQQQVLQQESTQSQQYQSYIDAFYPQSK